MTWKIVRPIDYLNMTPAARELWNAWTEPGNTVMTDEMKDAILTRAHKIQKSRRANRLGRNHLLEAMVAD